MNGSILCSTFLLLGIVGMVMLFSRIFGAPTENRRGPIWIVPRRRYPKHPQAFARATEAALRGDVDGMHAAVSGVPDPSTRTSMEADALLAAVDATLRDQPIATEPMDALRRVVAALDGADDAVRAAAKYIGASEWIGLLKSGRTTAPTTAMMMTAGERPLWTARAMVDGLFLDRSSFWCQAEIVVTNIGIAAIGERTMRAPRTSIITVQALDARTRAVRLADRMPLTIRFTDEIDAWTFHRIVQLGEGVALGGYS